MVTVPLCPARIFLASALDRHVFIVGYCHHRRTSGDSVAFLHFHAGHLSGNRGGHRQILGGAGRLFVCNLRLLQCQLCLLHGGLRRLGINRVKHLILFHRVADFKAVAENISGNHTHDRAGMNGLNGAGTGNSHAEVAVRGSLCRIVASHGNSTASAQHPREEKQYHHHDYRDQDQFLFAFLLFRQFRCSCNSGNFPFLCLCRCQV